MIRCFWDMTPCTLQTGTDVTEKPAVSVFSYKDAGSQLCRDAGIYLTNFIELNLRWPLYQFSETVSIISHQLTNSMEQSPSWKVTGPWLIKKFLTFYGNRSRIYKSPPFVLSWARLIQSMLPHTTSERSILILSSHLCLGLPSGLLLLSCNEGSVRFQGSCNRFVTRLMFFLQRGVFSASPNPQVEGTTCRLSAVAYSTYSQLPSTSGGRSSIRRWGRAMPWWQGPTNHRSGLIIGIIYGMQVEVCCVSILR